MIMMVTDMNTSGDEHLKTASTDTDIIATDITSRGDMIENRTKNILGTKGVTPDVMVNVHKGICSIQYVPLFLLSDISEISRRTPT